MIYVHLFCFTIFIVCSCVLVCAHVIEIGLRVDMFEVVYMIHDHPFNFSYDAGDGGWN